MTSGLGDDRLVLSTSAEASREDGVRLWPVYRAVFDDQPDPEAWLESMWEPHRTRDGFRLALVHQGGTAVGFAWGHTGAAGQWWSDAVRRTLDPSVADEWLGGHFEVVSLGVSAAARGRGAGRALLEALVAGLPHDRLLLQTTDDADDPARRLYASEGWVVLGAGTGPGRVVMGRRAPRPDPWRRPGASESAERPPRP